MYIHVHHNNIKQFQLALSPFFSCDIYNQERVLSPSNRSHLMPYEHKMTAMR